MPNPFITDPTLEPIADTSAKYIGPAPTQQIDSIYIHPTNGKKMKYEYNFYRTHDDHKGFGVINTGTKYNRVHQYRSVQMNAHTFVHNVALRMNEYPDTNGASIYEDVILAKPATPTLVDLEWNGIDAYELPASFFTGKDKYFIVNGADEINEWSNDGGPGVNVALSDTGAFTGGVERPVIALETSLIHGPPIDIGAAIHNETDLITALKSAA